jgi:hypothetical protein
MSSACPPNPKILRYLLDLLRPDEWGKHRISTFAQRGVLVVGHIAKKPEYSTAASVKARKWKVVFEAESGGKSPDPIKRYREILHCQCCRFSDLLSMTP